MAKKPAPVGHPRTVNKNLPADETLSGNPPRVRISGGPNRDSYAYRVEAEKKLGHKLPSNEVIDHINPNTKKEPNPKDRVITRSQNSRKDGGLRFNSKGREPNNSKAPVPKGR